MPSIDRSVKSGTGNERKKRLCVREGDREEERDREGGRGGREHI